MTKPISIGLLGAAKVAKRAIIDPAKKLENVQIGGIASRNKEKAKKFAKEWGIETVFSSYQALIESDTIDAVYILLANHLHTPWAIEAAQAKKPILVEKPLCLSVQEFDAIAQAVEDDRVPLLEGVMVQHHPWQQKLQEIIQAGTYGKLQSIKTRLTLQFSEAENADNYRFSPERGGGAFWDLGVYWIQLVQTCLGLQPDTIEAEADFNRPDGVDITFSARLNFPQDTFSEFYCSFDAPFSASHQIEFENTQIKIRNFLRPVLGQSMTLDIHHMDTEEVEKVKFPAQSYYVNQLNFFSQVIAGTVKTMPLSEVGDRVKIMEKIYNSASKKYCHQ